MGEQVTARDELIRYIETSPKPTRPGLSRLIGAVEREAVKAAPIVQYAAIAKPGDTILIGYDHRLSDGEFTEMTDRLRSMGEELGVQFGVIEGASSVTVVRSEADSE
jgi:hypothetical protein